MTDDQSLRCARRAHCADARTRNNTLPDGTTERVRIPAWAVDTGQMCRIDTQQAHRAVEKLPTDYLELGDLLGKTYGSPEPATGGTRELLVPIRLNVEALQTAIVDETARWAEAVAASVGMWFHPIGTRYDRIVYACGWLAGLFDRLLAHEAEEQQRLDPTDECLSGKDSRTWTVESGVDGAMRLLGLHEQVDALAGRVHRAERLWTPCPKCQRLALEHPEGANFVDCRRCGNRMPYGRYEELASILARAHESAAIEPTDTARPQPARIAEGPVSVWADGTEHPRIDAHCNMKLPHHLRNQGTAA